MHGSVQTARPDSDPSSVRAVGIVCDALGDPYSASLLQGAAQTLMAAGYHAVVMCGGFPLAPFYRNERGNPAIPSLAAAVIVISSTLRSLEAELTQLAGGDRGLVSIGVNVPGATNIASNDEAGVFQAVAHLVRRHQCKHVAFIAGPEESVDAGRRFEAYRFALEQLGLEYDPTLVTRGDYEAQSGRDAVLRLRQCNDGKFDALIAANDLMAIGAIEGLRAAGVAVPQSVKVFGFDDLEEAAFISPALSTVRQPLLEQGVEAAELAIRLLRGEAVDPTRTLIPAPLVVRRSCGCGLDEPETDSLRPTLGAAGLAHVEEALRGVVRTRLAAQRGRRELGLLGKAVLKAQDYPELAVALSPIVRLLRPERLLLCTYTTDRRHARVTLESSGNGVLLHSRPEPFPLSQLLPSSLLQSKRPTRWCVEPLELGGEHFGYLVLEGDLAEGIAPIELRNVLCAALARITMTRELRRLYSEDRKRSGPSSVTGLASAAPSPDSAGEGARPLSGGARE